MNPSSLSPADSPAASSAYQDYLDELVPAYGREDALDMAVEDGGAMSPPSPFHTIWRQSYLTSNIHLPPSNVRLSNPADTAQNSFLGSEHSRDGTSSGRPLYMSEGPVGRSSSPLSELFSPATPPEGSSQQQQQAPPDYNHLARFARIHSFMEARRRASESAAATGTSGGQSPARLSTASPLQSHLGSVPEEFFVNAPPNVNPFMGLSQGQPRPSVIRMSPPENSGIPVLSVERGQRQPSNIPPPRQRAIVVRTPVDSQDAVDRGEGLQRRLVVMQQRDVSEARDRSQVAIEEYLRNMRSSQRVQAFPPYQPPMQRQIVDGVTYVSQNPVYVPYASAPVANTASPSPAQASGEAGPSRSLSTRMNTSSPLVTVLHTNPGQVLSIDQALPMHRQGQPVLLGMRQPIPSLGPQHTAYTPSAEVYADRAVAVASSPSTSSGSMEVESALFDAAVRMSNQQNQAQGTQTDRMPRYRRHFHPEGPTSGLTEEETRLSSAERISRRRSERVASTPYDRLSAYTQSFTDRSSLQRAQPVLMGMDGIPSFVTGIPDYGTLREPSSSTWRQERETRMQADMQQRINAEMHVRERVRAAVEAREFPRSSSHVTVAGERLSVDQQIPTRHMGVSRDLNPYYQQIRNDQESNAERRRRLYYIPQSPAGPPGVHYHRLPASLLHFMESGAIFMHHDGEPKLILEQDVISAIAVDTQSFKFDNQFAATEECIICFDEFSLQQEVRVLSCNPTHRFHKDCIDKWLIKNKPNCPICRRILPSLNQPKEPVVNLEQEAGPSHTHGHTIRPSSSTEGSEAFSLLPDLLADYV